MQRCRWKLGKSCYLLVHSFWCSLMTIHHIRTQKQTFVQALYSPSSTPQSAAPRLYTIPARAVQSCRRVPGAIYNFIQCALWSLLPAQKEQRSLQRQKAGPSKPDHSAQVHEQIALVLSLGEQRVGKAARQCPVPTTQPRWSATQCPPVLQAVISCT